MEVHDLAKQKGWNDTDFPKWGNNPLYLKTIQGGYLLKDETPKQAYQRISKRASELLRMPDLEQKFFEILWNGWLIPSTPVMANMGTEIACPISCFSGYVGDSIYDIGRKNAEMMMLSKIGGGTAYDFSGVRANGSAIQDGRGGHSTGIIPFIKGFDSNIVASKQSNLRRGAVAIYLNAEHGDYEEFLRVRENKGEKDRMCTNIHQGAIFTDEFMNKVVNDPDSKERMLWLETIKKRVTTGEPYTFFIDNANKNLPDNWKTNNLRVRHSNLCSEIMLPTDEEHTLVCCLSSLNLTKYDEWKDTNCVFLSILFLDAVIEDFIIKSSKIKGIEDATRFAIKSRALGLGVMGLHTYLQSKMIPFISIMSNIVNKQIFSHIRNEAESASKYLANLLGEPEWCKGTGKRNLTLLAIAPTRSSSKLAGGVSQGVEPIAANIYMDDDAKSMHIRKNPNLECYLAGMNMNTEEVWDKIRAQKGSVQGLDIPEEDKKVFLTYKEINQLELVKLAGLRQEYIDQGQSINVSFFNDAPAEFINKVHIEAWRVGLKSLYYYRSEAVIKAESGGTEDQENEYMSIKKEINKDLYSECLMCEG